MANRPQVRSRRLTRAEISRFIAEPRGVVEFESVTEDVSVTLPDAIAALWDAIIALEARIDALEAGP
jgi:hypothetical protein